MKLTIAFLAALAAADAAEARTHRHARRAYGEPYGGGSYGDVSSVPAKPLDTPSPSSVVEAPYIQSSAEAFETSLPPHAASSYPPVEAIPTPPAGGKDDYPVYPPEVPEGGKSSVPAGAESSSILIPVETPYATPSKGADYGEGYPVPSPKTPSGEVPSSGVPSGVYPSPSGAPSGVYPSGGAGYPEPSVPVEAASSVPYGSGVYPSGGAGYPTGTGVSPASSTPLSDYVTKTIYSTQIYSASSALVTKVVPVGTTCIPKDQADETPSPAAPNKVTSKYPVSEVVKTLTETLVYTVGVGNNAHPVTTKVISVSTSTIYKTVVVTIPSSGEKSVYPEGKPEGPTGTTTIKSTTTSTKYITVKPTPSGKVPVGEQGYPIGGAGKPSGGEDCAVPVTVTVTAKETVTVTAGQDKPASTPSSGKPSKPEGEYPAPSGKPATPSAKYPIGNGTHPYPAGPTGFQTSTKPAYPVGTGSYGTDVPTKPSETSSLPYFSFVAEVPYETPSPSKTPSVESEVPYSPSSKVPSNEESYPTPTPAGGEYGSGYGGEVPAASSSVKPAETPYAPSSKVPSNEASYPTPTPAGNGYGSGYGTY